MTRRRTSKHSREHCIRLIDVCWCLAHIRLPVATLHHVTRLTSFERVHPRERQVYTANYVVWKLQAILCEVGPSCGLLLLLCWFTGRWYASSCSHSYPFRPCRPPLFTLSFSFFQLFGKLYSSRTSCTDPVTIPIQDESWRHQAGQRSERQALQKEGL